MVDPKTVQKAAELITAGKIVAIPTDTVYGLAADATSDKAVKRVFQVKGRSKSKPLSINVSSLEMAKEIAYISKKAEKLIKAFWPGALTIILPLKEGAKISKLVTAGHPTVGIRIPSHPFAIELMNHLHIPITSTSANIAGHPSPLNAAMVEEQLGKKINFIVDGGSTKLTDNSTIIDMSEEKPMLIRDGAISIADIEKVIGKVIY